MCSIFGMINNGAASPGMVSSNIVLMLHESRNRGRDGLGYHAKVTGPGFVEDKVLGSINTAQFIVDAPQRLSGLGALTLIGNARAEPTTEWVKDKNLYDQQPYSLRGWTVVHNGTIANDKELRAKCGQYHPSTIDSAAIVELLVENTDIEANWPSQEVMFNIFFETITALKGSYAILATHYMYPGVIFAACNYRPIWTLHNTEGKFFGSEPSLLPTNNGTPEMLDPYTAYLFDKTRSPLIKRPLVLNSSGQDKALVVCSGGMDSTVAATVVKNKGADVTLLNFQYGCRAESNEITAVEAVAEKLGVPLVKFPMNIYNPSDSPLFDHTAEIAGGEAGAEFAHEWVPARNLVMLAIATAYAEANGFNIIVLGNNLEEAGAYPDNEPEFVNKFNKILPFAVGDGKQVQVIMPVGNLMKHEIVSLGVASGAPLDVTWSCYRNGAHHCGTCGPCMMRKTAFEINGLKDPLVYESDLPGVENAE